MPVDKSCVVGFNADIMSDLPTQIYKSADFQSAITRLCSNFADIFCREVESEPARVEPLQLTGDGKMAYTEKWRPATSSVDGREGGDTVTERMDARAGSHRTLKIAVLQSYALGT
jgi:hypothetical protein